MTDKPIEGPRQRGQRFCRFWRYRTIGKRLPVDEPRPWLLLGAKAGTGLLAGARQPLLRKPDRLPLLVMELPTTPDPNGQQLQAYRETT